MTEGSSIMQIVVTAALAAALFVLVFAAANSDLPEPIANVLSPQAVVSAAS